MPLRMVMHHLQLVTSLHGHSRMCNCGYLFIGVLVQMDVLHTFRCKYAVMCNGMLKWISSPHGKSGQLFQKKKKKRDQLKNASRARRLGTRIE